MGDEIWKPVVGYEGRYAVSNYGRVKSFLTNRIMRPTTEPRGYLVLTLRGGDSTKKRFYLHTLVLSAFVGPRPEGLFACHKDDVKRNNQLENLYWGTHQDNMQDRLRNGGNPQSNKKRCPRGHRLTPPNLRQDRLKRGHRECKSCSLANRQYHRNPELDFVNTANEYYVKIMTGSDGCLADLC